MRPEQSMGSVFLSDIDEWSFQDHFLSKTTILTQRAMSPPSVTNEQPF